MDDVETRLRRVLTELAALRDHLRRLEYEAVQVARAAGLTWEQIGEAHEPPISRQRAQQRYNQPKQRRG